MKAADFRLVWLIAACVGVFLSAATGECAIKEVEEFDDYVDNAALRAEWVVAHGKDTVSVKVPGYKVSTQAMKISYDNEEDPYWTAVTMTFDEVQDWSDYRRFALRYIGMYPDDPPEGNSGETFFVRFYDEWGGYVDGPKHGDATKTWEWVYYAMDISTWAQRSNVQAVSLILEPQDYGSGRFYVDKIHVDTFPPILDDFETYADTNELSESWSCGPNGSDYLVDGSGPDGLPHMGDQYLALDYSCGEAPYQVDLTYEFDFQEDLSWHGEFLSVYFRARPGDLNSAESFQIILEDVYGGTFMGPLIEGATQCDSGEHPEYCPWIRYRMNFGGWSSKYFVKKVMLRIVPETYGSGRLYFDYLYIWSGFSPLKRISWGELKAVYR